MKRHTKETFHIFWQHAARYKGALFAIVSSIVIGDSFRIASPYLFKKFIDSFVEGTDTAKLLSFIWLILAFGIAHWFCITIARFVNNYFQTEVMRDLNVSCFSYLHKHSVSFFDNNFIGSLVKRVNRFSAAFEGIADRLIWDLLPILINVGLAIIVLGTRSIWFSLILIVWSIIFTLFSYGFSLFKLKYDVARAALDSKVTGLLADTVTNQTNVKFLNGYERELESYRGITEERKKMERWTWDLSAMADTVIWLFIIALEMTLMYVAIFLWQDGKITVGDFVLLQTYVILVSDKMWSIGRIIRDFYERLADAEEMTEILLQPHEIVDALRAKPLAVTKGEIVFDAVSFSYHKTRKIISKFSLTIAPKEKIAFVGHSGAGKSTIVRLLLRNHEVTSGRIKIDGQVLSQATLESLWESISYVPQDPILFHRTLMENIRYTKPEASDEEIFAAARLAHADEFIRELPDGYATFVGERGVKLSGGERQRVAIARAILKNAPILVLDEATSSLDSESERLIQDALDILMRDKTVIVVAHRLSTIMKMDRIVVLDAGKIVEEGTHSKLIRKKNGMYRRLWEIQAGNFIAS